MLAALFPFKPHVLDSLPPGEEDFTFPNGGYSNHIKLVPSVFERKLVHKKSPLFTFHYRKMKSFISSCHTEKFFPAWWQVLSLSKKQKSNKKVTQIVLKQHFINKFTHSFSQCSHSTHKFGTNGNARWVQFFSFIIV